jgi:hypothetical protein
MTSTTWRTVMGGLAMAGALGTLGCSSGDDDDSADKAAPSSTTAPTTTTTTAPTTTTTAAPRVVYEVEGAGTVVVSYTGSDDRMLNAEVTLPWSEEQTEDPSRLSMLVALTGSPGDVTCRIRRGTEVLAEETLAGTAGPLLSCDYPPSGLPQVTFP